MAPPDFYKVLKDFVEDLFTTFPELQAPLLRQIQAAPLEPRTPELEEVYESVFGHVMKFMPAKCFEILSENASIFDAACECLPGVDFKLLWTSNISAATKTAIWKYLKLMLLIGAKGNPSGMFDFDQDIKEKLDAAADDLHNFFKDGAAAEPEDMHENLKGLLTGKLGDLAKEIADEALGSSPEEMQQTMKDPSKLFGLVHKVGDTIDKKIKNGDLKESELLEEASAMLQKMKDMPGMGGFEAMFQKFAGGKMDVPGMQAKMAQNTKQAKTKERMRQKLGKKQAEAKQAEAKQAEAKFTAGAPAEKSKKKKGLKASKQHVE